MIAMMVFTLVIGSVVLLLTKSQTIFRTEQGVSEMDQNARLLIDFLTRDIQQSKENALGIGPNFRSIYSYNGPEGKTDELTIVSSDTETKIPSGALPLIAATPVDFRVAGGYVELLPNGAGDFRSSDVVNLFEPDEEFIVSTVLEGGSVQFDFMKVKRAHLTQTGFIGVTFEAVQHRGVESEVDFGSTYANGAYSLRPVTIKRYFIDRQTDKAHPALALSVNDSAPITISRNVVAFQLRYLEVADGQVEGQWVKEQNISSRHRTLAVEVTMTARTEIKGDPQAERLVTLASVVRPRYPGDGFGSSGGGGSSPGAPGDGLPGDPGFGDPGAGGGTGDGGPGGRPGGGFGDPGGPGGPASAGGPDGGAQDPGLTPGNEGSGGIESGGYKKETRRIGRQPRLGERLWRKP
ncbi:MAG: hypothetical protein L0229_09735 [Blastocatellia bacterium]|nr:hypothetical protein [Blastocatellia bacterium]